MNSHFYLCNCRALKMVVKDERSAFRVFVCVMCDAARFPKKMMVLVNMMCTGMGQILECKNTIWYITTTTTTSCHHRLLLHQHEIKGDDHYYVYVVAMVLRHLIELPCWGLD